MQPGGGRSEGRKLVEGRHCLPARFIRKGRHPAVLQISVKEEFIVFGQYFFIKDLYLRLYSSKDYAIGGLYLDCKSLVRGSIPP
jgi:hypothetical protein